jgi:hypothetical protein
MSNNASYFNILWPILGLFAIKQNRSFGNNFGNKLQFSPRRFRGSTLGRGPALGESSGPSGLSFSAILASTSSAVRQRE